MKTTKDRVQMWLSGKWEGRQSTRDSQNREQVRVVSLSEEGAWNMQEDLR